MAWYWLLTVICTEMVSCGKGLYFQVKSYVVPRRGVSDMVTWWTSSLHWRLSPTLSAALLIFNPVQPSVSLMTPSSSGSSFSCRTRCSSKTIISLSSVSPSHLSVCPQYVSVHLCTLGNNDGFSSVFWLMSVEFVSFLILCCCVVAWCYVAGCH